MKLAFVLLSALLLHDASAKKKNNKHKNNKHENNVEETGMLPDNNEEMASLPTIGNEQDPPVLPPQSKNAPTEEASSPANTPDIKAIVEKLLPLIKQYGPKILDYLKPYLGPLVEKIKPYWEKNKCIIIEKLPKELKTLAQLMFPECSSNKLLQFLGGFKKGGGGGGGTPDFSKLFNN